MDPQAPPRAVLGSEVGGDLGITVTLVEPGLIKTGFAGRYGVVDVIYVEWFDNIVDAIAREKQLKGIRRDKKLSLIRMRNPRLQRLLSPLFQFPVDVA